MAPRLNVLGIVLLFFLKEVTCVCVNADPDEQCDQRAADGECYFTITTGCTCTWSCQSLEECPNHPSGGDTDCLCRSSFVVADCPTYAAMCPLTCQLRSSVVCDALATAPSATPSVTNPHYLDIVTYTCDTGYRIVGGDEGRRVCIENGTWFVHPVKGALPVCEIISCGTSPVVVSATASQPSGVFGDEITYFCNHGFVHVGGGNGTMSCNETGLWDPDPIYGNVPICQEMQCGSSPNVENATASHPSGVYGDKITYSCRLGFVQVGGMNGLTICNVSGLWDPDPVLGDLPVCSAISCGTSPAVVDATPSQPSGVFGDEITYSCNSGFIHVGGGNGTMSCNESGLWDPDPLYGNVPVCQAISCGPPHAEDNASASQPSGVFGDEIIYSCNPGFVQVGGGNGTMSCNESGLWDPDPIYGAMPICQAIACGSSPSVENATASQPQGVFGDVIWFLCNVGYVKEGGSNGTLECNASGVWAPHPLHGQLPVCNAISCGASPSVSNASASQPSGVFGDEIIYSCNPGLVQVGGGNGTMSCNESGLWDPDPIYGNVPVCQEILATSYSGTSTETPSSTAIEQILQASSSGAFSTGNIGITSSNFEPSTTSIFSESVSESSSTLQLSSELVSSSSVFVYVESYSTVASPILSSLLGTQLQPQLVSSALVSSPSIQGTDIQPSLASLMLSSSLSPSPSSPTLSEYKEPPKIIAACIPRRKSRQFSNSTTYYSSSIPKTKKFIPVVVEAKGAETFGAVAIVLLVSFGASVVIIDITGINRHLKLFKENMHDAFERMKEFKNKNGHISEEFESNDNKKNNTNESEEQYIGDDDSLKDTEGTFADSDSAL